MYQKFQMFSAVLAFILSVYMLVTQNFSVQPVASFFIATFILMVGLKDRKREQKGFAYVYIGLSAYLYISCVQGIFALFQ